MAKSRPAGGRPPGRRSGGGSRPGQGGGGGGSGGYTGGTRHKSSSSVHDGIRILVVSMATAVVLTVGGVGAFLAHGYGVF